ncbi:MAG TPA: C4-type zinc ribbon domain-containing protein [Planctomycetota bacterium]|nr:C4-type zinc ribbon domain-containing protein [Planctomycetota bacterium]
MRETLQALQSLQEFDTEIFKLRDELRRLPQELERRKAQIDAHRARRDEALRIARGFDAQVKEIEDMSTISRQRLRKVENEANSSRGDAATLAAYQIEARNLKRDISASEEEGLGLVEKSEAQAREVARLEGEIAEAEKLLKEFTANVEAEAAVANQRLAELLEKRKQRSTGKVAQDAMELYQRLILAREGIALAELDGKVCQACFITVPPNVSVRVLRGTALVQCPSCDRIFYLRD